MFVITCKVLGIQKTMITARNPKSYGLTERQKKTLEKLLGMFCDKNQFDWDKQLPYVLVGFRSSVQESTQETPNVMSFCRETSLPLMLPLGPFLLRSP